MAAAPGLLVWLLVLGLPWRVPGQLDPSTGKRFSEHKLCADDECSSECAGGRPAPGSPRRRRLAVRGPEFRSPAGRPGGRRRDGRNAGMGALRVPVSAFSRSVSAQPCGPDHGGLHLPLVASVLFSSAGAGGCLRWSPASPGVAHSVPFPPPAIRPGWEGRCGCAPRVWAPHAAAKAILPALRGPRWVQYPGRCAKGSDAGGRFPSGRLMVGFLRKGSLALLLCPSALLGFGLVPPFEQKLGV